MSISCSNAPACIERFPTQQSLYFDETEAQIICQDKDVLMKLCEIFAKPFLKRSKKENEIAISMLLKFEHLKSLLKDQSPISKKEFLLSFSQKVKWEYFTEGEIIFNEGDIDDKVSFVIQGKAIGYSQTSSEELIKRQESDKKRPKVLKFTREKKSISLSSFNDLQSNLTQSKKKGIQRLTTLESLNCVDETKYSSKVVSTLDEIIETLHIGTLLGESDNQLSVNNLEEPISLNTDSKQEKYDLKTSQSSSKSIIKNEINFYKPTLKVQAGDCLNQHIQKTNHKCTLIAIEDLYLISLTKQEYNNLLQDLNNTLQLKIEFLKEILPLNLQINFPKFASLFEECHYSFQSPIFHEDEILDCIYIVQEGEIQLSIQLEEIKCMIKGQDKLYLKSNKKHLVGSITKGDIIEGDEFLDGKTKYNATVRTPKATLLKISLSIYKNLNRKYKNVFDYLRHKSQFKQEMRNNKIQKIIQTVNENNLIFEQKEKEAKIESNISTRQEFFDKLILNNKINCQDILEKENNQHEGSDGEFSSHFRNTPLEKNNGQKILFQRGFIQNPESNLLSNKRRTRPVTSSSRENDNFVLDLIPPSKDKKILLVNKRKREISSKAQKERGNRVKLENDSSYRTYVDQLQSVVNCLSNRNINPGPSFLNFENTITSINDLATPLTTVSIVPTGNTNETPKSQKFKLKDLLQSSKRHVTPRDLKLVSPQFKASSNLISKANIKQSFSSVLETKPSVPLQREGSGNEFLKEKNTSSSLLEKVYNISITNIHTENDIRDSMGISPNRSLLIHKRRRFHNGSPEKARNIHVERKTCNDYGSSSTRSQEPLLSSSRKMFSSTKHNMFRLKSNKLILQERYVSNRTLETGTD